MTVYGGPGGPVRKTSTTVWIVVATVVCGLVFDGIVGAVVIPVFLSTRGTAAGSSERGASDGGSSDGGSSNGGSPNGGASERDPADALALADVSTLGKEMATWYVDNSGAPAVQVSGGQYVVQGTPVGPVSPGITFGGVTGTGATDWCVWVSNPQGTIPEVSYSAMNGLQEGRC